MISTILFFIFKIYFTCLWKRKQGRRVSEWARERGGFCSLVHFPNAHTSPQFMQGLSREYQGCNLLDCQLGISKKLELEVEGVLEPSHSNVRCDQCRQQVNSSVKHLPCTSIYLFICAKWADDSTIPVTAQCTSGKTDSTGVAWPEYRSGGDSKSYLD